MALLLSTGGARWRQPRMRAVARPQEVTRVSRHGDALPGWRRTGAGRHAMTRSSRSPASPGRENLGLRATLGSARSPVLIGELKGNGCVAWLNGSDDTSAVLCRLTAMGHPPRKTSTRTAGPAPETRNRSATCQFPCFLST